VGSRARLHRVLPAPAASRVRARRRARPPTARRPSRGSRPPTASSSRAGLAVPRSRGSRGRSTASMVLGASSPVGWEGRPASSRGSLAGPASSKGSSARLASSRGSSRGNSAALPAALGHPAAARLAAWAACSRASCRRWCRPTGACGVQACMSAGCCMQKSWSWQPRAICRHEHWLPLVPAEHRCCIAGWRPSTRRRPCRASLPSWTAWTSSPWPQSGTWSAVAFDACAARLRHSHPQHPALSCIRYLYQPCLSQCTSIDQASLLSTQPVELATDLATLVLYGANRYQQPLTSCMRTVLLAHKLLHRADSDISVPCASADIVIFAGLRSSICSIFVYLDWLGWTDFASKSTTFDLSTFHRLLVPSRSGF
jgi:hypothetical protein